MAEIAGEKYTKPELLKRSVNIGQLASIDEVVLKDGRARDLQVYRARSASGLAFDLLPGRCLDISALSYRGVNISLLTRNGVVSPENMFPAGGEFERYFGAGMLWTCGLKNCGPNYVDEYARFHHYHGRIGTLPVEQAWKKSYFKDGEYYLSAGAVTRDTVIEGYNLELTREVQTTLSKPEIVVTDSIENLDGSETDYLLLYHFNFGFPFIGESLKMLFPDAASPMAAANSASQQAMDGWHQLGAPVDHAAEHIFFHTLKPDPDGMITIRLENPKIGIGSYLQYESEYSPYLVQWKCERAYEYALGIEPSNNWIGGLQAERDAGRSRIIKPGEKHRIRVILGFYDL